MRSGSSRTWFETPDVVAKIGAMTSDYLCHRKGATRLKLHKACKDQFESPGLTILQPGRDF